MLKDWLEYLGGVRDQSPDPRRLPLQSPLWGVFWAILIFVLFVFGAQTSRFIYVDF